MKKSRADYLFQSETGAPYYWNCPDSLSMVSGFRSTPVKPRIAYDGIQRRADVMAYRAEEHAPGLLCRMGAFKRFLEFRHMLHRLLVRDDEDMKEAVADEAAECGKRRERPDNLKSDRRRDRDAEQDHHHAPPANDIPVAASFCEHAKRYQDIEGDQKTEGRIAQGTRLINTLGIKKEKAFVEGIGRQSREVECQDRIAGP